MTIKLKFADTVISVKSTNPAVRLEVPGVYRQFMTDGRADITILAGIADRLSYTTATPVFLSGGNWDLYQQNGKWLIPVCFPPGTDPLVVANFDLDFSSGELWINKRSMWRSQTYPLAYPLDELLMINFLALGRGVEFHACAVAVDDLEKGLIFIGVSGAGKSTLTRLWQKRTGVTVLSDDRVILRKKDGRYWVYGTPWHGDALGASSRAIEVDRIFILRHSLHNELTPLKPVDASAKLLVRCFPTFWNSGGMAFTLKFLDELSQSIPCHEFGFLPDQSAINFILQHVTG